MIQHCEAKAYQAGQQNRRHIEKNPSHKLPTHTSTITNQLSGLTVDEAIERNNEVLLLLARWVLKRFGRLGVSSAFDEKDLPCFVKPTERDTNDLRQYMIGGKDSEDVFRFYVTVLTFPAISVKLPIRYDLCSYIDLKTGERKGGRLEVETYVAKSLETLKQLPRLPRRHHLDRGFFAWDNWAQFVAFHKYSLERGQECRVITPASKTHYASDEMHTNPLLVDLNHKSTRRTLHNGPLSPNHIHANAERYARTKISEERYLGFFEHGAPGAPNLLPGMAIVVERIRKVADPIEDIDLGGGWVGRITYVTVVNPTALQLAEDAASYRDRNFIESTFWHFEWGFEEAGVHRMAGRALLFGLALIVLSLHALTRIWRGHYVRLGRFDYPLIDFLVDLYKTHTIPDEPG